MEDTVVDSLRWIWVNCSDRWPQKEVDCRRSPPQNSLIAWSSSLVEYLNIIIQMVCSLHVHRCLYFWLFNRPRLGNSLKKHWWCVGLRELTQLRWKVIKASECTFVQNLCVKYIPHIFLQPISRRCSFQVVTPLVVKRKAYESWKTSLGWPIFRCYVSFREGSTSATMFIYDA